MNFSIVIPTNELRLHDPNSPQKVRCFKGTASNYEQLITELQRSLSVRLHCLCCVKKTCTN